jgi:hypothetical protein
MRVRKTCRECFAARILTLRVYVGTTALLTAPCGTGVHTEQWRQRRHLVAVFLILLQPCLSGEAYPACSSVCCPAMARVMTSQHAVTLLQPPDARSVQQARHMSRFLLYPAAGVRWRLNTPAW